jgi:hypothetical protein
MLLSDHGWLWARGFEGGGPHVALYRRIAHWLMQEPSLEEEAMRASAFGRTLRIERQTMSETTGPATVKLPSGEVRDVELHPSKTVCSRRTDPRCARIGGSHIGRAKALAHVGAVDAPEFRATVSSAEVLAPVAAQSGGLTARINAAASNLPQILPTRAASVNAGDRMGLRASNESVLKGVRALPLFGGFLGLALLILALGATWFREGR